MRRCRSTTGGTKKIQVRGGGVSGRLSATLSRPGAKNVEDQRVVSATIVKGVGAGPGLDQTAGNARIGPLQAPRREQSGSGCAGRCIGHCASPAPASGAEESWDACERWAAQQSRGTNADREAVWKTSHVRVHIRMYRRIPSIGLFARAYPGLDVRAKGLFSTGGCFGLSLQLPTSNAQPPKRAGSRQRAGSRENISRSCAFHPDGSTPIALGVGSWRLGVELGEALLLTFDTNRCTLRLV